MRTGPILVISIFGCVVHASTLNPCLTMVLQNLKLTLSNTALACMGENQDVKRGLIYLCNGEQSNISSEYGTYFSYEIDFNEAFKAYQSATDLSAKMAAQSKMNEIEQNWLLFGFRAETDEALNLVYSGESSCRDQ